MSPEVSRFFTSFFFYPRVAEEGAVDFAGFPYFDMFVVDVSEE